MVRETYASSNAVLEHLGRVGPMLGRMVELGGGLELDVLGSLSPELSEAVAAFSPTIYSYAQGK